MTRTGFDDVFGGGADGGGGRLGIRWRDRQLG